MKGTQLIIKPICSHLRKLALNQKVKVYSTIKQQISFKSPTFLRYIENLRFEYENLMNETKLNKTKIQRLQYLKPIIEIINKQNEILSNVEALKEISDSENEEMKKLVLEEKQEFSKKLDYLEENLREALLNDNEDQCNSILFEITAGVGGQEAMLFARNLYEMYLNYFDYKGWNCTIAQLDNSDVGGVRHASLLIDGDDIFSYLNVEAGVHRVQRVPTTERSGRIHTSTVTVAAIPQPDEIEIELKAQDLRIETKRAGGAGGQHVNTTDSAVRIVHIPSNIAVECQTERSQIKNKEIAMRKLRMKLYENICNNQIAAGNATRKAQVASSLRSEKIRTYNFNQQRISDHRLQQNIYNFNSFLEGNEVLDELICMLRDHARVNSILERMQKLGCCSS